ncbi:hypothetical protein JM83_3337 [Gillisia sp. Hel_I_86]|uniref:hypothetical protein n=1 Tax=Gillisia sp. Hel_I_86 TaxID=1249981 RepID=UPI00119B23B5|nr:hypothetical protein [Gillisia sp. Hel_I_86]TVZ28224.1 hypothetical protein JM83_3337 [Gillisia sp. Hel_I_86]
MIDENFISTAYSTMERGFPEIRKRKRQMAGRSLLKIFLRIFFVKPEETHEKIFLLHPKPEIQKIFTDAIKLDINNSAFLKKALFYLQLGYISPNDRIRVWAAKRGYNYLQYYFRPSNITILNCGPSILSPFLAKLCEDKNDDSKYYIIQHGLYQLNNMPYEFEFSIKASRSVVWSSLLAQNYIALGIASEKIHVLPTYLFREIKELNRSNKVLIIGESLNKINTEFDVEYQEKLLEVINYLKLNSKYNDFHFKKHPRALSSPELDTALENNSVKLTDKINLNNYGLVIGAISTLMIEAMAEGCRVLQISLENCQSLNVGDYSLHTSAENLQDIREVSKKIGSLDNLEYNFINREFLRVDNNFEDYYKQLLE